MKSKDVITKIIESLKADEDGLRRQIVFLRAQLQYNQNLQVAVVKFQAEEEQQKAAEEAAAKVVEEEVKKAEEAKRKSRKGRMKK